MSIFITGDIHASYDISKLNSSNFDTTALTKQDVVIICGDFGLVWNNTPSEQYWLRWLDAKPFTTLFIDGNHEGFAALDALPTETWNGGKVHRAGESIYHLMRGELYTYEGTTLFAMGGAASSAYDRTHRTEGIGWFPEEVPSEEERKHALETLEAANWSCDIVLTHCAPTSCAEGISQATNRLTLHPMDEYTNWLDEIRKRLTYKHWFCGHYHVDAKIAADTTALYNKIVKLCDAESFKSKDKSDAVPYTIIEKPSHAEAEPAADPFESLDEEIE